MKILLINTFFSPHGGAEVVAYEEYKYLKKQGHNVWFYAIKQDNYFENDVDFIKYFPKLDKGLMSYILKMPKYYYNFEAKNNLEKLINDFKPDIVHCHNLYALTYSVIDICYKYKIPIIKTIHDTSIICPTGKFLYKNKKYCSKMFCKNGNFLECAKNKCAGKFEPSLRYSFVNLFNSNFRFYNKINYFITPSNALKQAVIVANVGIREDKIITINNFINNDCLNEPFNNKTGEYFLFCARLVKEKGWDILLEAMKDTNIPLKIIGDGADRCEIEQYIKNNNLENVELKGKLNQKELYNEYRNCIALICPSSWFEIFGLVNIEAFAFSKPAIASDIGGIREIIEHNKNGILFEAGNVEQLKNAIINIWQNRNNLEEMRKNAKESSKKYSLQNYYENLMKIFKSILC